MTEKTQQLIGNFEHELEKQEENKRNAICKSKFYRKGAPEFLHDHPIYKELKDVIICNDLSKLCPRRWDELEINFEDKNIRYSTIMQTDIVKVTNEHNYNMIKDKNISFVLPYNGVLHQKLPTEFQNYIKDYVFIQISRRIMMDCDYREEDDINTIDKNEAIKFIFEYIKNSINENYWCDFKCWVQRYREYDIDLEEIINNSNYKEIFNK